MYIYICISVYVFICVLCSSNTKHENTLFRQNQRHLKCFVIATGLLLFDVYSCWIERVVSFVLGNSMEIRMFLQQTIVPATIICFRGRRMFLQYLFVFYQIGVMQDMFCRTFSGCVSMQTLFVLSLGTFQTNIMSSNQNLFCFIFNHGQCSKQSLCFCKNHFLVCGTICSLQVLFGCTIDN